MIELQHLIHLIILIYPEIKFNNNTSKSLFKLVNNLTILSIPSPLCIYKATVYKTFAPKGFSIISSNSSKLGSLCIISWLA